MFTNDIDVKYSFCEIFLLKIFLKILKKRLNTYNLLINNNKNIN